MKNKSLWMSLTYRHKDFTMNCRLFFLLILTCSACGKAAAPQPIDPSPTQSAPSQSPDRAPVPAPDEAPETPSQTPPEQSPIDPNAQAFFSGVRAYLGNEHGYNLAVADSPAMSCGVLGRPAAPKGGIVYFVSLTSVWGPKEEAESEVPPDTYQLGTRQNPNDANITTTMTATQVTLDDNCTALWKPLSQATLAVDSNSQGTLTVVNDTNQTLSLPYNASYMDDIAKAGEVVWPTNPNASQPASVQVLPISNPNIVAEQYSTSFPNSVGSSNRVRLVFRDPALTCDHGADAPAGAAHGGGEFVVNINSQSNDAAALGNHAALEGTFTLYDGTCKAQSTPITGGVVSITKSSNVGQNDAHLEGTAVLLFGAQKVTMPFVIGGASQ